MFQLLSETFENQSGRSRYVRVIWFTDNTIPNSTAKNEMATAYHICVLSLGLINESVAILAQSLQYAAAANCAFAIANSNAHVCFAVMFSSMARVGVPVAVRVKRARVKEEVKDFTNGS